MGLNSVEDILEDWIRNYYDTDETPKGVDISFYEFATNFDEDTQEEYIEESQPVYEVKIHRNSHELEEFPDSDTIVDYEQEVISFFVTYDIEEDWTFVEKMPNSYFSDDEIEVLLNGLNENIH